MSDRDMNTLANTAGGRDSVALSHAEVMAGEISKKWPATSTDTFAILQALMFVAVRLSMALEEGELDE